jgi:hypothetical protein
MKGQTYQLRDTADAPADLTGTIVVADRPIAVFASHQVATLPAPNLFFANYLVEQLPPTELWGTDFFTTPLATRKKADTFRVLALLDGTTVQIDGLPNQALNRNQFYEFQLSAAAHVVSDHPVLLAQYSNSSDYDRVDNSDPFMVLVPATSSYVNTYTVQIPTTGFPANYINVVVPAAAVGQMTLDGTVVQTQFSPVGASGYAYAQISVTATGPHTISSQNGTPFGVIVYGWNLYDAYGYPGATCSSPQVITTNFTCPPTNVVVQAGAGCVGVVPDLTKQVGNASLAAMILQDPPAGTTLTSGTYPVIVTIIDPLGQRQLCTTSLMITSSNNLVCPPDITTNATSSAGQYVSYQVGLCDTNFTITCTPPPGSLFKPGVTLVSCVASNAAGIVQTCTFTVTVTYPVIAITHSGSTVTLTWTGAGTLQTASTLGGPWVTLTNAPSPYRFSTSSTQAFFRLRTAGP